MKMMFENKKKANTHMKLREGKYFQNDMIVTDEDDEDIYNGELQDYFREDLNTLHNMLVEFNAKWDGHGDYNGYEEVLAEETAEDLYNAIQEAIRQTDTSDLF